MNNKIKFIYFEKYFISGKEDSTTPQIRNENILILQPKTNSNGIWEYINITERKYNPNKLTIEKSYTVVEQYWIDLEKYNPSKKIDNQLKQNIEETLTKLNRLVNREDTINQLLNNNN